MVALTLEEAAGGCPSSRARAATTPGWRSSARRPWPRSGVQGVLLGGPVLQQAHARGLLPALLAPWPTRARSGRDLQRARAHRGATWTRDTLLRLAAHPNVVAVKEASGSLAQIMEILRDRPGGLHRALRRRRLHPAVMALGGEGVISVVSNQIPREMHDLVAAARRGATWPRRAASTTASWTS